MERHHHINVDAAPPAETALTRFRAAQDAFVTAAVVLGRAWDGVPGYAGTAYPFEHDFDEMLTRILNWKVATDREPVGNPRRPVARRLNNGAEPVRTWIGDVEWSCECGDGGPADFDLIDEDGDMIFGIAAVGHVHGDGTEPGALYRCGRCGLRVRNAARPTIGTRYRLSRAVDRFPHGEVPAGSLGTIVAYDRDTIALRLDEPVAWLDEWNNGVLWHEEHAQHFYEDCEPFPRPTTILDIGIAWEAPLPAFDCFVAVDMDGELWASPMRADGTNEENWGDCEDPDACGDGRAFLAGVNAALGTTFWLTEHGTVDRRPPAPPPPPATWSAREDGTVPADDEPCLCGDLGMHWICGVRDPKAQRALVWTAATLAATLGVAYTGDVDACDTDYTTAELLINDMVLLMAERGLTAWTPEGFE